MKYEYKYENYLLLYKNILISYLCGSTISCIFDVVFDIVFEIILNTTKNMITN